MRRMGFTVIWTSFTFFSINSSGIPSHCPFFRYASQVAFDSGELLSIATNYIVDLVFHCAWAFSLALKLRALSVLYLWAVEQNSIVGFKLVFTCSLSYTVFILSLAIFRLLQINS